ncbi:MAG: ATP-dependent Clp protease ATP-binding subunit, partial [Verrucomicrobia bacterium]|nr:ATP-dependent Clp protease ATP-binding subunit [Verrucomicrobiota bacterium]
MHDAEVDLSGVPSPDAVEQWRFYLSGLRNFLETRVAGQSGALGKIVRAIQSAELGFNHSGRGPKGSFLLLGPTGVGKTESAKCFSEYIFGSRAALEMIFMNEYSSDVRFREFLERTEASIRRHPSGSTLLFDEIEKAHPKLVD